jgi:hypothetical protein
MDIRSEEHSDGEKGLKGFGHESTEVPFQKTDQETNEQSIPSVGV